MTRIGEDRLRELFGELGDQMPAEAPEAESAVRRAKRRVARNTVATVLAAAMVVYGSVQVATRIGGPSRTEPVRPAPSPGAGLWTLDARGANAVQITNGTSDDEPAWSPDGRRIAFTRMVDGNSEVFIVDADGTNPRSVTRSDDDETSPVWTPDGRRIAFVRGEPDAPVIYSIAPDGSDLRTIVDGRGPAFSYGGKWLTYECPSRGEGILCQTDPSGETSPVEVDLGGRRGTNPVWINDSTLVFSELGDEPRLVAKNYLTKAFEPQPHFPGHWMRGLRGKPGPFEGLLYSVGGDLFTTTGGGPKVERLTFDPTIHESHATWNPVAKRIVARRVVDPPTAIFVADADGSNVRRLSGGTRVDGGAVMSPDGSTIAFASSRDGYAAIYLMDAGGSNERRVTHETAGMVRPLWSPDSRLLYVVRMHPMNPLERGIGVIAADGGLATEILEPRPDFTVPSLSLDGARVVYAFGRSDDQRSLFVANADGSQERRLTFGWVDWPVWGPEERIAYLDGPSTQRRLAIVNADGSGKRILGPVHLSTQGLWWGTGLEILFASNGDIYAADPATGAIRVVLALPGNQYNPSWTPDGRILFNGER